MAAFNPLTPRDPTDERQSHEPSMEEILASIRRIISDDQSLTAAPAEPMQLDVEPQAPPLAPPPAAATELTNASAQWPYAREPVNAMRSAGSANADRRPPEPYPRPVVPEQKPLFSKPVPEIKPVELKPSDFADMRLRQHLEEEVSDTAFSPIPKRAADPVPVLQEPVAQEEIPILSPATDAAVASSFNALLTSKLLPNAETLAEMAREMLRPMLKAWLDDNLPVMVERLVRAEIERVARGGR